MAALRWWMNRPPDIRCLRFHRQGAVSTLFQNVLIDDDKHQRQCKHNNGKQFKPLACRRRDGFFRRYLTLGLDALRGQFKRPGEKQRKRESDDADVKYDAIKAFGEMEGWYSHVRYLDYQPGKCEIGHAHPEDISSF